jgi:hypothetical protein
MNIDSLISSFIVRLHKYKKNHPEYNLIVVKNFFYGRSIDQELTNDHEYVKKQWVPVQSTKEDNYKFPMECPEPSENPNFLINSKHNETRITTNFSEELDHGIMRKSFVNKKQETEVIMSSKLESVLRLEFIRTKISEDDFIGTLVMPHNIENPGNDDLFQEAEKQIKQLENMVDEFKGRIESLSTEITQLNDEIHQLKASNKPSKVSDHMPSYEHQMLEGDKEIIESTEDFFMKQDRRTERSSHLAEISGNGKKLFEEYVMAIKREKEFLFKHAKYNIEGENMRNDMMSSMAKDPPIPDILRKYNFYGEFDDEYGDDDIDAYELSFVD